ncbi:transmembrane protein 272-like [Tachypleus tridentatus]|uniref:transmembrane protein 272-like n=1 Tax=Tachypleus tridentatus TaxID=6853 RepID=UPI003FD29943
MKESTEDLIKNENKPLEGEHPVSTASASADYGSMDNAPPTYEESPKGNPPSYNTIIGKIRRAKQEATGPLEFVKMTFAIIFGSIVWLTILILTLCIPIAMVVIGSTYIHSCPRQPFIPILLVVGGAVVILSNLLNILDKCSRMRSDTTSVRRTRVIACITTLLNCFTLAWFIAGCVWVYGIYQPSYDPNNKDLYCNKTLYLFSFWLLNANFIFMGLLLLMGFIGLCCGFLL